MASSDPTKPVDPDRLPSALAVQSYGGCNLRCSMCAMSVVAPRAHGPMPFRLFEKAVRELHGAGVLREVCLSLQCEPLLDPLLIERMQYVKALNPPPAVTLSTNAVRLTPACLAELVESGLDVLNLSLDAYSRENFAALCGADCFEDTVRHIAHALETWGPRPGLSISTMLCRRNAHEVLETDLAVIRRAGELGVPTAVSPISNHCGWLESYEEEVVFPALQSSTARTWCRDLFDAFHVLVDGTVIGCCSDFGAAHRLGDLTERPLSDIWHDSETERRRQDLLTDSFAELEPCRRCSQAANILAHRRQAARGAHPG